MNNTDYTPPLIWSTSVHFFDPNYTDDTHPDGQRTYVSFFYYPSNDAEEEQLANLKQRFDNWKTRKGKESVTDPEFKVKALGRFRWWLTWFSHSTDQKFDTAEDALRDFRNFLMEYDAYDWDHERESKFPWCPMGAEDYWRHNVCECDYCKESKTWAVRH